MEKTPASVKPRLAVVEGEERRIAVKKLVPGLMKRYSGAKEKWDRKENALV